MFSKDSDSQALHANAHPYIQKYANTKSDEHMAGESLGFGVNYSLLNFKTVQVHLHRLSFFPSLPFIADIHVFPQDFRDSTNPRVLSFSPDEAGSVLLKRVSEHACVAQPSSYFTCSNMP